MADPSVDGSTAADGSTTLDGSPQTGHTKVEKMIGVAGGTIEAPDGTKLEIPPNSLSGDVLIGIASEAAPAALGEGTFVGPTWHLTPHGQTFSYLVALPTLTLTFDPARLPATTMATHVRVVKKPANGTSYAAHNTKVVAPERITSSIYSFSTVGAAVSNSTGVCHADPTFGNKCCREALGDSECKTIMKGAKPYAWQCDKDTAIFRVEDAHGATCASYSTLTYTAWCCTKPD